MRRKIIETYKGYEICLLTAGQGHTTYYNITGSCMALNSIKAAHNVIDTQLNSVNS